MSKRTGDVNELIRSRVKLHAFTVITALKESLSLYRKPELYHLKIPSQKNGGFS
jgi:hypothetical protein